MSYCLFYGKSRKPIAYVVPDARHPRMYRLVLPDGTLTDMVNLARANDAAIAICERGPPTRNRRLFNWRQDTSKIASEAGPIRSIESPGLAPVCHVDATTEAA